MNNFRAIKIAIIWKETFNNKILDSYEINEFRTMCRCNNISIEEVLLTMKRI